MATTLHRASYRFLLRHPWQLALAVVGIALGVSVVVAIDLAMTSSLDAFDRANKALSGTANYRIVASDGGLDEALYVRLRVDQGFDRLSPVVKGNVTVAGRPDSYLNLIGIDPFIEKSFQAAWQGDNEGGRNTWLNRLVTEPGTALVGAVTAERLGWREYDEIRIETDRGPATLKIIGLLRPDNPVAKQLLSQLIITDIATAQETLGTTGRLNAIDVIVDPAQSERLDRLRKALPTGAILVSMESQAQAMQEMTRAYDLNLQAMSLLSLLVGMFLIYNTMTFLVLQRRRLLATLRSLGVTRGQIFKLILGEALLIAGAGIVIGILLGIVLGQGVLSLIAGTINAFYFRVDASTLSLSVWQLAKAVLLGFAATVLAVLPPAFDATRIAPSTIWVRSNLEQGMRRLFTSAIWISAALIAASLLLTGYSGKGIASGLVAVFLLMLGFALLTPVLALMAMKLADALISRSGGVVARMPARLIGAEISRTGIAIAALMIAVAATIGMDLMIGSFRQTVADWLKTTLRADLYVSMMSERAPGERAGGDHRLKTALAQLEGVDQLSTVLHTKMLVDGKLTKMTVYEMIKPSRPGFVFKHALPGDFWQRFERDATVIITEPYAYLHHVNLGAKLRLRGDHGDKLYEVIGIYADYSGDQGHLAMSRQNYSKDWPDLGYSGIGVYVRDGTDINRLERDIGKRLTDRQSLKSNRAIYEASMELFEQTFAVTETLRWLSALIAIAGVFSALMAIQFERTQELGILRAIGMTPKQLGLLIVAETGLMGLVAGLIAVPVGFAVAYQLIFVVYRRSFGWTMAFQPDAGTISQGLALALTAALLAGVLPAMKMARTQPAEALRTE